MRPLALLLVATLSVAGCAAGGARSRGEPASAKKHSQKATTAGKGAPAQADESGGFAAVSDWEAFARTRSFLAKDIDQRANALREGAVGDGAIQLASLRMAAKAPALIDKGSLDGAVELLERAVSLYGGNGYAYLFLAYVHHVRGHDERAAGFLSSARRYLPKDKGVRGETEGLARSIMGNRLSRVSSAALGAVG